MPAISMFYGIVIYMYFLDTGKHKLPHIHARFQNEESVFDIVSGEILEGNLSKPKAKLVQAWVEIHKDELRADWDLAIKGEHPFKIEPLR